MTDPQPWLLALAILTLPLSGRSQDWDREKNRKRGPHHAWLLRLESDRRDERAIEQLVELGPGAVPILREILLQEESDIRWLDVKTANGRWAGGKHAVPIAKIRALEVIRRMDFNAAPLVPELLDLLDADTTWLGNVLEALYYVDFGCRDPQLKITEAVNQIVLGRNTMQRRNGNAPRRPTRFVPNVGRVAAPRGEEILETAPRDLLLRARLFGSGLVNPNYTLMLEKLRGSYFEREFACCYIRQRHRKNPVSPNVERQLLDELERYYPEDQSAEAEMFRDQANKINPRYLNELARTVVAVTPEKSVLAHVHLTLSGSLPKRRAEFFAIARFEAQAAPAVPWLISFTKHHDQEFAKEAFMVLGQLGATARSALPALRDIAKGKEALRAKMATAAIRNMTTSMRRLRRDKPRTKK